MAQKTVAYTTGVTPGSYTSADVTVDNQGLITAVSSGGGSGSFQNNIWLPSDYIPGALAWTFDPGSTSAATNSNLVSGQVKVQAIKLPSNISVSNVILYFGTNTTTFTAGQNFVGLYQGNALVASSADMAATWQGQTGLITCPLAGAPIALTAGIVYVAILGNFTGGSLFHLLISTFPNPGLAAPALRGATQNGQTSLPANLNGTTSGGISWACLS